LFNYLRYCRELRCGSKIWTDETAGMILTKKRETRRTMRKWMRGW